MWKDRLYSKYVSTGQAQADPDRIGRLQSSPHLRRIIKKLLPPQLDIAIVDLACGHGPMVNELIAAGYRNVRGIDISPEQVDLARRYGVPNVECNDIRGFLRELRHGVKVFFLFDILEHFEKEEVFELLDLIFDKLEDDGLLILHVPNGEGLFGMRIFFGDFTHASCFTARSLRQILSATNFKHVACFEDVPVVHGVKSLVRRVLWHFMTAPVRLLMAAETGGTKFILSQNILACARKSGSSSTSLNS